MRQRNIITTVKCWNNFNNQIDVLLFQRKIFQILMIKRGIPMKSKKRRECTQKRKKKRKIKKEKKKTEGYK